MSASKSRRSSAHFASTAITGLVERPSAQDGRADGSHRERSAFQRAKQPTALGHIPAKRRQGDGTKTLRGAGSVGARRAQRERTVDGEGLENIFGVVHGTAEGALGQRHDEPFRVAHFPKCAGLFAVAYAVSEAAPPKARAIVATNFEGDGGGHERPEPRTHSVFVDADYPHPAGVARKGRPPMRMAMPWAHRVRICGQITRSKAAGLGPFGDDRAAESYRSTWLSARLFPVHTNTWTQHPWLYDT